VENSFRLTGFMGTNDSYEAAKAIILGVPMDFTVSLRPGSRTGPQQVRTFSYGLEEYSIYQNKSLENLAFYDAGDLTLPFGNITKSMDIIEKAAERIFADDKLPIFLGGEHLVSYPLIKACYKHYPELYVIHFDAHADLRSEYEGEVYSHATVMRKVAELLGSRRIYQFGIRSGIKEEFEFAREHTHIYVNEIFPSLRDAVLLLKQKPVYISLDIDVLDPAYAPGTGTPEPGGFTSREIIEAILTMAPLNVVGMDIVEISPPNDHSERTAILGAKLVREALLAYVK